MTNADSYMPERRTYSLGIVPRDGIGPEVTDGAVAVLDEPERLFGFSTSRESIDAGARHYLATGELFDGAVRDRLYVKDPILFGSMSDPAVAPGVLERGFILAMRQEFEQAVNLPPVRLYPGVQTPIAGLKPERRDLVIVRENIEGSYVGRGSMIHAGTANTVAVQESVNTRAGIGRVIDYAFRLASVRRRKLTLCHKNVLVEAGKLWQETVNDIATHYPGVEVGDVHVDAPCFHLSLTPEWFDVVVTDNLLGDIITDLDAVIQDGLGVAASANLNLDSSAPSMFEAIHGSAPDIAGMGLANPAGAVLSLALCMAHLGGQRAALAVESAVVHVLGQMQGYGRASMGGGTSEVGSRIVATLASGDTPGFGGASVMEAIVAAGSRPAST